MSSSIRIFYGADYALHSGPTSSAETGDRIAAAVDLLRQNHPDIVTCVEGSSPVPTHVDGLEDRFQTSPEYSCVECTFINPRGTMMCDACGADMRQPHLRFLYVSATDGDTTYYGSGTRACIANVMAVLRRGVSHVNDTRQDAFLLVRPPGHHCGANGGHGASGFCLVNNIIEALDLLPAGAFKTVAVLDWDAHRGNGVQQLALARPNLHVFDLYQSGIFPFDQPTDAPNMHQFPLPAGTGDEAYRPVLQRAIDQLAALGPDLVLVASGFDAHVDDALSDLQLSTATYGWGAARLREAVPTVPKVYLLEGGYRPGVVAECVARIVEDGYGGGGNAAAAQPGAPAAAGGAVPS